MGNKPDETLTVAGLTVEIYQDEDCTSPREWDHPATIVAWPGNRGYQIQDPLNKWATGWANAEEFLKWIKRTRAPFLPLFVYEHSQVIVKTGRPDEDRPEELERADGFIYWDPAQSLACCGRGAKHWARARKFRDMEEQIAEYNRWGTGDCWGYVVKTADGEELDSCWGHIGIEYAHEAATEAANACAENRAKEDAANARTLALYAD